MLIAGIDEAGRGSLLGPLVIACVIIKDDDLAKLKSIGVKDSKALSKRRRAILYERIKDIAKLLIKVIDAKSIDEFRRNASINNLELIAIAELLSKDKIDKAYIDSFDPKPRRLEDRLKSILDYDCIIVANHREDKTNPIVSAASIVAKVVRDHHIDRLKAIYGEVGSGYPSDNITREFIKAWIIKHKSYPEFARITWKSMDKITRSLQLSMHDPYQMALD